MTAATSLLLPPGIWAAHFFLIYGAQGLAGREPYSLSSWLTVLVPTAVAAAILLGLAATCLVARRQPQRTGGTLRRFLVDSSLSLSVLSLLALLWSAFSVLLA
jgi:hypothetical protein